MERETHEMTAERIQQGTKSLVRVTIDGRRIDLGGKRAERAAAVILVRWPEDETAGVWGLRGDLDAARTEAHRLETQTERRTRSRFGGPSKVLPIRSVAWAGVAVVS